jgi:hypothetical protein
MDKHLNDARFLAATVKGTPLASNWAPLARFRARRRGLVGANLKRYCDAVRAFLMAELHNTFARVRPV